MRDLSVEDFRAAIEDGSMTWPPLLIGDVLYGQITATDELVRTRALDLWEGGSL